MLLQVFVSYMPFFWASLAAFGTYFCMYAFRKPISVAEFQDEAVWGWAYKSLAVTSQLVGYVLAKLISIKYASEVSPRHRAIWIVALLGVAEVALLGFAIVSRPYNLVMLVFNGLPLGMVFGFVLGFLEGRRNTEAMAAILCTSFILADGMTKSCGRWLLQVGLSEYWMPASVGLIFTIPALVFVWMLTKIPQPTFSDIQARSTRVEMTSLDRKRFFVKYSSCLLPITLMFVLITIMRSVRSDFAPELWRSLGVMTTPQLFGITELWVGLVVTLLNGIAIYWSDNRQAIRFSFALSIAGVLLIILCSLSLQYRIVSPFLYMMLLGIGLYLPYVAVHTTVFERFIAITRERSNLAFLMCLADFAGYLGYVLVLIGKGVFKSTENFMEFMLPLTYCAGVASLLCMIFAWYFMDLERLTEAADASSPQIS